MKIKFLNGDEKEFANLRGADLRGADLHRADLRRANLGEADLHGADLGGADLGGAYLGGADLRGADLRGADLRGAYLGGADLRGADLRGAIGAMSCGTPYEWMVVIVQWKDGIRIAVGCRWFTIPKAIDHWKDRNDRKRMIDLIDYIKTLEGNI